MRPNQKQTRIPAALTDRESSYCVWLLDTMASAPHAIQRRLPAQVRFIPAHQVLLHMPAIRKGGVGTRTHPWAMEMPPQPPSLAGKELNEHRALWCVDTPQDWFAHRGHERALIPVEQSLMDTLTARWGRCPLSLALCHWYTVIRASLRTLRTLGTPVFVSIGHRSKLPEKHFWRRDAPEEQPLTMLSMPTSIHALLRQLIQDAWICLQQLQSNPQGAAHADEHMRKVFRALILPRKASSAPVFNTHMAVLRRHDLPSSPSVTSTATEISARHDVELPVAGPAAGPTRTYKKISAYI